MTLISCVSFATRTLFWPRCGLCGVFFFCQYSVVRVSQTAEGKKHFHKFKAATHSQAGSQCILLSLFLIAEYIGNHVQGGNEQQCEDTKGAM